MKKNKKESGNSISEIKLPPAPELIYIYEGFWTEKIVYPNNQKCRF